MKIFVSFNRIGEPLLPFVDEVESVRTFAYGSNAGGINTGWGVIRNDETLRRLIAAHRKTGHLNPRLVGEGIDYNDARISSLPAETQTIEEVIVFLREREAEKQAKRRQFFREVTENWLSATGPETDHKGWFAWKYGKAPDVDIVPDDLREKVATEQARRTAEVGEWEEVTTKYGPTHHRYDFRCSLCNK